MGLNTKTIWYCHHYAGPPSFNLGSRPYHMVKAFRDAGHNAFVIAASYHHLKNEDNQQKKSIESRIVDEVPFISLKTSTYKKNGFLRIINMLQYAFHFFHQSKQMIALTGKPDIIIVSSPHPFHYLPLAKIAKQQGAILIFEVRDLWPLSLTKLLNLSQWNPMVIILGAIEKKAYKHADFVVSLLNNAYAYMGTKGLNHSKFKVIPNGIQIQAAADKQSEQLKLDVSLQSKIDGLKKEKTFIIAYTGSIGKPNALEYLIEAMRELQSKNAAIHCMIVGQGQLKKQLEANAADLYNISFIPTISKDKIPLFLNQMDALYIGWNDSDLYQYGISPNKIYTYMLSGKPIIESCAPKVSFVNLYDCGLRCEPGQSMEIAHTIEKISTMPSSELQKMGEKGKDAVIKYYDFKVLARQYMSIF